MELHDQLQPFGELRDGFRKRRPVIGFEQPRLGIGLGRAEGWIGVRITVLQIHDPRRQLCSHIVIFPH